MEYFPVCVRLCLLYFLLLTKNVFVNTTESLPSSASSLPSSSPPSSSSSSFACSPHSFMIQKTTRTKGCSNCVLVPEEALHNLLEMTNATIKELQSQEPEESSDLHVGDEVPHLPTMEEVLSQGSESCNQRLLLAFWESEARNLQLKKKIHKQEEETNAGKEELEREKEGKDQVLRECHPNPHHRHHRHRHRPHHPQPYSLPGTHPLSMTSDTTTILRSDLRDIKEDILNAIIDVRDNGRFHHQDIKESILDGFLDIRYNGIECSKREPEMEKQEWLQTKDCYDHFESGGKRESGVYTIYPFKDGSESQGVRVWCDMGEEEAVGEEKGGGWTVILKRKHHPQKVTFRRTWEEYRVGFGDLLTEYWIGNEVLHQLTTLGQPQTLRIDMTDFDGIHKFASYGRFSVGSEEENFRLTVGMFSSKSTVKEDSLAYHNSMAFSTYDRDNDKFSGNCVTSEGGGGGFWMNLCQLVNPTAPISGKGKNFKEMHYYGFNKDRTILKQLSMKIKPSV